MYEEHVQEQFQMVGDEDRGTERAARRFGGGIRLRASEGVVDTLSDEEPPDVL